MIHSPSVCTRSRRHSYHGSWNGSCVGGRCLSPSSHKHIAKRRDRFPAKSVFPPKGRGEAARENRFPPSSYEKRISRHMSWRAFLLCLRERLRALSHSGDSRRRFLAGPIDGVGAILYFPFLSAREPHGLSRSPQSERASGWFFIPWLRTRTSRAHRVPSEIDFQGQREITRSHIVTFPRFCSLPWRNMFALVPAA